MNIQSDIYYGIGQIPRSVRLKAFSILIGVFFLAIYILFGLKLNFPYSGQATTLRNSAIFVIRDLPKTAFRQIKEGDVFRVNKFIDTTKHSSLLVLSKTPSAGLLFCKLSIPAKTALAITESDSTIVLNYRTRNLRSNLYEKIFSSK